MGYPYPFSMEKNRLEYNRFSGYTIQFRKNWLKASL